MLGAGLSAEGGGFDLLWLRVGSVCTQSMPDVSHVEYVKALLLNQIQHRNLPFQMMQLLLCLLGCFSSFS